MCIVLNLRPFRVFSNNLDASDFLWAFPSTKVPKSHLTCHPVGSEGICVRVYTPYIGDGHPTF